MQRDAQVGRAEEAGIVARLEPGRTNARVLPQLLAALDLLHEGGFPGTFASHEHDERGQLQPWPRSLLTLCMLE